MFNLNYLLWSTNLLSARQSDWRTENWSTSLRNACCNTVASHCGTRTCTAVEVGWLLPQTLQLLRETRSPACWKRLLSTILVMQLSFCRTNWLSGMLWMNLQKSTLEEKCGWVSVFTLGCLKASLHTSRKASLHTSRKASLHTSIQASVHTSPLELSRRSGPKKPPDDLRLDLRVSLVLWTPRGFCLRI